MSYKHGSGSGATLCDACRVVVAEGVPPPDRCHEIDLCDECAGQRVVVEVTRLQALRAARAVHPPRSTREPGWEGAPPPWAAHLAGTLERAALGLGGDGSRLKLLAVETGHTVASGSEQRVHASAPFPWRAVAVSVPAEIAPHFRVTSISVGGREHAPGSPIPCSALSDARCVECRRARVCEGLPVEWPEVPPGLLLSLTVRNDDHAAHTFRACLEVAEIATRTPEQALRDAPRGA